MLSILFIQLATFISYIILIIPKLTTLVISFRASYMITWFVLEKFIYKSVCLISWAIICGTSKTHSTGGATRVPNTDNNTYSLECGSPEQGV